MGWLVLWAVVAVLAFLWWRGRNAIEVDDGGVSHVRTGDADMARAFAQARQSFQSFVDRLRDPQPGDENFGIKAGIPTRDGDSIEHIWLSEVVVDAEGFEGTIANEPRALPLALGDRWRGRLDQLSDWTYFHNGRMQGNFTARAMLPRLPKAQQAQMRALPESFQRLSLPDGRAVRYLCLYFLTPAEREAIAREGWESFSARLAPERLSLQ